MRLHGRGLWMKRTGPCRKRGVVKARLRVTGEGREGDAVRGRDGGRRVHFSSCEGSAGRWHTGHSSANAPGLLGWKHHSPWGARPLATLSQSQQSLARKTSRIQLPLSMGRTLRGPARCWAPHCALQGDNAMRSSRESPVQSLPGCGRRPPPQAP